MFLRIRRFAGFCVAIAIVCGFGRMAAVAPAEPETAAQPTEIPPGKLVSPAKDLKYVGVGGCSAAACHGGPMTSDPGRLWNCSYTIWATQEPLATPENRSTKTADHAQLIDKHNRAYAVLYEKRSKQIVQLLDHLPDADAAQPYKDARCVACHSVPRDPATVPISILADGVGCELCHGPAKNWLARHTEKQWIEDYHAGKSSPLPDMNDTRSLLSRARICAGCHVGSPGDASATYAGRQSRFDRRRASAARFRVPRISRRDAEALARRERGQAHFAPKASQNEPVPDRETHAEAWAIGQVVAAEAALKLLAHRAAGDGKDSRMPLAGVFGIRLLRLPSPVGRQISKSPSASGRTAIRAESPRFAPLGHLVFSGGPVLDRKRTLRKMARRFRPAARRIERRNEPLECGR